MTPRQLANLKSLLMSAIVVAGITLAICALLLSFLIGYATRGHAAAVYPLFPNDAPTKASPLPDYGAAIPRDVALPVQKRPPRPRLPRRLPDPIPATGTIILDWHVPNIIDGGEIDAFERQVTRAIARGQSVQIRGVACMSACTIWLRMPPHRICATPDTVFVFHHARERATGRVARAETQRAFFEPLPARMILAIMAAGDIDAGDVRVPALDLVARCPN